MAPFPTDGVLGGLPRIKSTIPWCAEFPGGREKCREFPRIQPFSAKSVAKTSANSDICERIPYAAEQGINSPEHGIHSAFSTGAGNLRRGDSYSAFRSSGLHPLGAFATPAVSSSTSPARAASAGLGETVVSGGGTVDLLAMTDRLRRSDSACSDWRKRPGKGAIQATVRSRANRKSTAPFQIVQTLTSPAEPARRRERQLRRLRHARRLTRRISSAAAILFIMCASLRWKRGVSPPSAARGFHRRQNRLRPTHRSAPTATGDRLPCFNRSPKARS